MQANDSHMLVIFFLSVANRIGGVKVIKTQLTPILFQRICGEAQKSQKSYG